MNLFMDQIWPADQRLPSPALLETVQSCFKTLGNFMQAFFVKILLLLQKCYALIFLFKLHLQSDFLQYYVF